MLFLPWFHKVREQDQDPFGAYPGGLKANLGLIQGNLGYVWGLSRGSEAHLGSTHWGWKPILANPRGSEAHLGQIQGVKSPFGVNPGGSSTHSQTSWAHSEGVGLFCGKDLPILTYFQPILGPFRCSEARLGSIQGVAGPFGNYP